MRACDARSWAAGLAGLCAVLGGCDATTKPELLSDLPAFAGRIVVRTAPAPAPARLDGALEFDRGRARIAFTHTVDGREVVLRKDGAGPLEVTHGGVATPASLSDIGDFALLQQLLLSPPEVGAGIETLPDGYAVVFGDQRLEVSMTPAPRQGG